MLVLRPQIDEEDISESLIRAFLLLGNGYDFKFDFTDATYHCCTELIYHALDGAGPIRFSLKKRMGKMTLSADDIIRHYLDGGDHAFDLVLLAQKDPRQKGYKALIMTGDEGAEHLAQLMEKRRFKPELLIDIGH
jgi:hypothetical protein